MARAARHRESDAASRRAYVRADVATRFGGKSEGPGAYLSVFYQTSVVAAVAPRRSQARRVL